MWEKFTNFDGLILLPMILLAGFSLVVIGSSDASFFWSQGIFFLAGLILFFLFNSLEIGIFQSLWMPLYILVLILLSVSFLGPEVRGVTRWIEVFGFRIQFSELAKPLLILSQSAFLVRFPPQTIKRLLLFLGLFSIPILLVFKQPDLGNAIIYAFTMFGLLFIAGTPSKYIASLLAIFFVFIPVGWEVLKEYQKQRILSFLNPYVDTSGVGYNAIQSMIAVGSGQLFGRGLGRGPQSQLRFLPENHTDFIFASLSEELGFLASFLVLASYFVLLFQLFKIAYREDGAFEKLVVYGAFFQLFFHVVVNVGMNVGLLPITGITLPLISYGGSSVVATCILLGIVHSQSVSRRKVNKTIAIG